MNEEPFTIENALDVLRSWTWLYVELERTGADSDQDIREGAAKGRNRQCSIGWHSECSDRSGINWNEGDCACPCHQAEWERVATLLRWMDGCLAALAPMQES